MHVGQNGIQGEGDVPTLKLMLDALGRIGYGGIVLNTFGQMLVSNDPAEKMLLRFDNSVVRTADSDRWRESLKALLRSKGASRFRMNENSWVVIRREAGQPLVVHAIPLPDGAQSGPHTLLILVDLQNAPLPSGEALHKIFGLTPAEASLAVEIAAGRALDDLARLRGVAVGTIRKQLASIFTKTGTSRQSELVALLSRASILP